MEIHVSDKVLIISVIIYGIVTFFMGFTIGYKERATYHNVTKIDTLYNKVTLDSIAYNIRRIDSTIVKYRYKYEEEIIHADSLCDSASVELFKRLVSE